MKSIVHDLDNIIELVSEESVKPEFEIYFHKDIFLELCFNLMEIDITRTSRTDFI